MSAERSNVTVIPPQRQTKSPIPSLPLGDGGRGGAFNLHARLSPNPGRIALNIPFDNKQARLGAQPNSLPTGSKSESALSPTAPILVPNTDPIVNFPHRDAFGRKIKGLRNPNLYPDEPSPYSTENQGGGEGGGGEPPVFSGQPEGYDDGERGNEDPIQKVKRKMQETLEEIKATGKELSEDDEAIALKKALDQLNSRWQKKKVTRQINAERADKNQGELHPPPGPERIYTGETREERRREADRTFRATEHGQEATRRANEKALELRRQQREEGAEEREKLRREAHEKAVEHERAYEQSRERRDSKNLWNRNRYKKKKEQERLQNQQSTTDDNESPTEPSSIKQESTPEQKKPKDGHVSWERLYGSPEEPEINPYDY